MEKDKHQASFISTFHLASIPARLAVERHLWHDAVALEPETPDYLPWENAYWPIGLTWFARGLGSFHTGDLELAKEAEQQLGRLRDQAKAGGEQLDATYIEIDRRILAGWIAAEDDREEAVQLIRSAAHLEGTVEKPAVSPGALLPPYEALGDLLINMERAVEALEAYQLSDDIWPGRFNTLLGAARAANAAGDETTARKYYRRLCEIAGDSGRAGISEARQFLDK